MNRRALTIPEIVFVVVTRALLASGVALLVSELFSRSIRRKAAWVLTAVGLLTTPFAARLVFSSARELRDDDATDRS